MSQSKEDSGTKFVKPSSDCEAVVRIPEGPSADSVPQSPAAVSSDISDSKGTVEEKVTRNSSKPESESKESTKFNPEETEFKVEDHVFNVGHVMIESLKFKP